MRIYQYLTGILFLLFNNKKDQSMRNCITCIVLLSLLSGCTKDFDLYRSDPPPLYVIEGRISSMWGPYYVRVTKSAGLVTPPGGNINAPDGVEAVKDALVIITDDTGMRDTLIPAPTSIERYVYYIRDTIHYLDVTIDSIYSRVSYPMLTHEHGYYQTTKIKGQAGHTYQLEVQVGNDTFRSSAYMPPVPMLERAAYRDTTLSPYLNSGSMRLAYFKDPPNVRNYYMLTAPDYIYGYRYDHYLHPSEVNNHAVTIVAYYVFDDKLLTPDVNAMPALYMNYDPEVPLYSYEIPAPWPRQVRLQSLTKEAYDYFDNLSKQIKDDDGNIYKPVPSSVPGNISGGALGLFYATDVSDKLAYP